MVSCVQSLAPISWHYLEGLRASTRWGLAGGIKSVETLPGEVRLLGSAFTLFFLNHGQTGETSPSILLWPKGHLLMLSCYNISLRLDLNPLFISGFCQVFY